MTDESKNTDVTPEGGGETAAPKTLTQEEVDRIVAQRLAREREKFADYDDLRKKAETLEAKIKQREEAEMTEAEKAKARAAELEAEVEKLTGYKDKWSAYEERQKAAVEEAIKDFPDDDKRFVLNQPLDDQMAAVNRLKAAATQKAPIPGGKGPVNGLPTKEEVLEMRAKGDPRWREFWAKLRLS